MSSRDKGVHHADPLRIEDMATTSFRISKRIHSSWEITCLILVDCFGKLVGA